MKAYWLNPVTNASAVSTDDTVSSVGYVVAAGYFATYFSAGAELFAYAAELNGNPGDLKTRFISGS